MSGWDSSDWQQGHYNHDNWNSPSDTSGWASWQGNSSRSNNTSWDSVGAWSSTAWSSSDSWKPDATDTKNKETKEDYSNFTYLGGEKTKSLPLASRQALIQAITESKISPVFLTQCKAIVLDSILYLLTGAGPYSRISGLSSEASSLATVLKGAFEERHTSTEQVELLQKLKSFALQNDQESTVRLAVAAGMPINEEEKDKPTSKRNADWRSDSSRSTSNLNLDAILSSTKQLKKCDTDEEIIRMEKRKKLAELKRDAAAAEYEAEIAAVRDATMVQSPPSTPISKTSQHPLSPTLSRSVVQSPIPIGDTSPHQRTSHPAAAATSGSSLTENLKQRARILGMSSEEPEKGGEQAHHSSAVPPQVFCLKFIHGNVCLI